MYVVVAAFQMFIQAGWREFGLESRPKASPQQMVMNTLRFECIVRSTLREKGCHRFLVVREPLKCRASNGPDSVFPNAERTGLCFSEHRTDRTCI